VEIIQLYGVSLYIILSQELFVINNNSHLYFTGNHGNNQILTSCLNHFYYIMAELGVRFAISDKVFFSLDNLS